MAGRREQLRRALGGAARLGRRMARATRTASWRPAAVEPVSVVNAPHASSIPRGTRIRDEVAGHEIEPEPRAGVVFDQCSEGSKSLPEPREQAGRHPCGITRIDGEECCCAFVECRYR